MSVSTEPITLNEDTPNEVQVRVITDVRGEQISNIWIRILNTHWLLLNKNSYWWWKTDTTFLWGNWFRMTIISLSIGQFHLIQLTFSTLINIWIPSRLYSNRIWKDYDILNRLFISFWFRLPIEFFGNSCLADKFAKYA